MDSGLIRGLSQPQCPQRRIPCPSRRGDRKEERTTTVSNCVPLQCSQSSRSFFDGRPCDKDARRPLRRSVYNANDARDDGNFRIAKPADNRAIHAFVMMQNVQRSRFKPGKHVQDCHPYSGCFLMSAYSSASSLPGLRRIASGIPTFQCRAQRRDFEIAQGVFIEAEFWPTRRPTPQSVCAHLYSNPQVQQLIEGADHRIVSTEACSSRSLIRKLPEREATARWQASAA